MTDGEGSSRDREGAAHGDGDLYANLYVDVLGWKI